MTKTATKTDKVKLTEEKKAANRRAAVIKRRETMARQKEAAMDAATRMAELAKGKPAPSKATKQAALEAACASVEAKADAIVANPPAFVVSANEPIVETASQYLDRIVTEEVTNNPEPTTPVGMHAVFTRQNKTYEAVKAFSQDSVQSDDEFEFEEFTSVPVQKERIREEKYPFGKLVEKAKAKPDMVHAVFIPGPPSGFSGTVTAANVRYQGCGYHFIVESNIIKAGVKGARIIVMPGDYAPRQRTKRVINGNPIDALIGREKDFYNRLVAASMPTPLCEDDGSVWHDVNLTEVVTNMTYKGKKTMLNALAKAGVYRDGAQVGVWGTVRIS